MEDHVGHVWRVWPRESSCGEDYVQLFFDRMWVILYMHVCYISMYVCVLWRHVCMRGYYMNDCFLIGCELYIHVCMCYIAHVISKHNKLIHKRIYLTTCKSNVDVQTWLPMQSIQYTCMYIHTCMHAYIHISARIHARPHTYIHTYIHQYIQIIRTYIHIMHT